MSLEFSDYGSKIDGKRLNNRPGRGQPVRGVGLARRQGRLCVHHWGEGPVLQSLSALGLNASL